ncbi:hypothetical protein ACJ73_04741, partial [Blastomyces percursus]
LSKRSGSRRLARWSPRGLDRSSPVAFPHRSPRTKGAPSQQRTGEQMDRIKPQEEREKERAGAETLDLPTKN